MTSATQVRDVGTVFLLKRPLIVAPGVVAGIVMLIAAGVRGPQLIALACLLSTMFLLFCVEAWYGRRTLVSERWLLWSLRLTVTALCLACGLSGGLHSPFLPLTFAPVVVAFAAFGRARSAVVRTRCARHGRCTLRVQPRQDARFRGVTEPGAQISVAAATNL